MDSTVTWKIYSKFEVWLWFFAAFFFGGGTGARLVFFVQRNSSQLITLIGIGPLWHCTNSLGTMMNSIKMAPLESGKNPLSFKS